MKEIAIIITTIYRNDLLEKTIKSITKKHILNSHLIICNQTPTRLYPNSKNMSILNLPEDCGLSYARNKGVEKAKELNIPYCLITADSILFDKNMDKIHVLLRQIPKHFDLIGLDIKNRIGWEAWLKLIPNSHFELDFIKKEPCKNCNYIVYKCDIVRNFFIATTESLLNVKWDNNLKMLEHEDFFHRYKLSKYKVGCTKNFQGKYINYKTKEYVKIRKKNMHEGMKILKNKYNLKGWVKYKHLERIKEI